MRRKHRPRFEATRGHSASQGTTVTAGSTKVCSAGDLKVRGVCHDLLQPTSTIGALVAMASARDDLPEDLSQDLDRIREETQRMRAICEDLVVERQKQTVRVDRVLERLLVSISTTAPCRIVSELESVVADVVAVSLERAVQNLVSNACRAAGAGGRVFVGTRATADWVDIEVSDDGPGFGSIDCGTASLGLGIVHETAREHGGRMSFSPSRLGGVAAHLWLPQPGLA
jgi:signal transduction histidine kinase